MVIYKWINQIKAGKHITFYGNGETARGYTYVDDLVNGVYSLILKENSEMPGMTIHLGGSEIIKLSDLLNIFDDICIKKKINVKIDSFPMPAEDVVDSYADTSLAFMFIGFAPEKRFKKIITNILKKEL
jgi:UDP-glucuronate 4-epimerase